VMEIYLSRLGADVAPFAPIKNSTRVANHNKTHMSLEHSIRKCRQYADHVLNSMRHFRESFGRAENVYGCLAGTKNKRHVSRSLCYTVCAIPRQTI
jgi:hypothetical protein